MNKYDAYIWAVEKYLMQKYGVDAMYRIIDPLTWYINTGRASVSFLQLLVQTKPFIIDRILAKGGSHDDVVRNIRKRIGLPDVIA